jgi:uroporphyrinogen decarboxylase
VALYGILCGPLTLAGHLRGVRIFTDVYKNKDVAKEIIEFCGQVAAEAARIYAEEIGCDVIAITDPVASQSEGSTACKAVASLCRLQVDFNLGRLWRSHRHGPAPFCLASQCIER